MAREKGTFNFSANLEVKKQGALDSRLVVQTYAELVLAATWADSDNKIWLYDGMIVSVVADQTGKNGVYKLDNKDAYNVESSWTRIDAAAAVSTVIVDNLTSESTTSALSANQGKVLKGEIDSHTGDSDVHITSAERSKLANIASNAEVNQNAFSKVKVGEDTIEAETKTDTLNIAGGAGITVSADTENDKITIASSITNASTTFAGLMSSADKKKLNGIEEGANNYTHPVHDSATLGFYKVSVDEEGHVDNVSTVTKTDIVNLGIPSENTHYESKNVVGSSTSTSNTTTALGNGNVYLNSVENGNVTSSHKISGSGNTTVKTDTSGNIIIESPTTLAWGNVSGKPETFTPSEHEHTKSEITDFPGTKELKVNGSSFDVYTDETDLPTIYAPTTVGSNGQVLKSNGSNVYWGTDNNDNTWREVALTDGTTDTSVVGSATTTGKLKFKAGSNVGLSANGGVITINSTDTNTTYSVSGALDGNTHKTTLTGSDGSSSDSIVPAMTAATSSAAGKAGLVPAPAKGDQGKFLNGSGSWATPNDTTYTFTNGTDGSFTVTPKNGSANKISIGKPATAGAADSAAKVDNNLTVTVNSGTTEGTDKYTFDGSNAKSLNIVAGNNVTLTPSVGGLKIDSSYTNTDEKVKVTTGTTTKSYLVGVNSNGYTSGNATDKLITDTGVYLDTTAGKLTAKELNATTLSGNLKGTIDSSTTATTAAAGDNSTKIATTSFVGTAISTALGELADAMIFKGVLNAPSDLPSTHEVGWTYRIGVEGTYAGYDCEVGDMIICITAGTTSTNSHWTVAQNNIDGAVVGPTGSVSGNFAIFDGTTGKIIKDSGKKASDFIYTAGTGLSLSNNEFSINSSLTEGTYGPSSNVTGSEGTTISVPQITVDENGLITEISQKTYTSKNTDTHYTTGLYVGASGAKANAATTNGDTYIKLYDNDTSRASFKISGSGKTTVTSDSSGNITINSTDTNTTYGLSGALSGDTFVSTLTPSSGNVTTSTVPAMGGASSTAAGTAGLVPGAAAGDQGKFLKADGTWATPENTKYSTMTANVASTGTETTGKLISAKVLHDKISGMLPTDATTSKSGLMSSTDKTKLDGIEENANNYVHPTDNTAITSAGLYKITSNAEGHITSATAVSKSDITSLGIPAQDTTYTKMTATEATTGTATTARSITAKVLHDKISEMLPGTVTTSKEGLMSVSDKNKLDGIASGAEVNQNAFSNITVGSTTISADSKTDTLTLVAGSNVTITPDATNDKITIAATDTKSFTISAGASDDDVVILSGTQGTNGVSYSASHAKKFSEEGNTYTSGNTTTSISGSGGKGTIKIPQITVDEYGHVTSASDESVSITLPTIPTLSGLSGVGTVEATGTAPLSLSASKSGTTVSISGSVSAFTGASSSAAGASGIVPAPAKGDQSKFLKADGTWATPANDNTTYTFASGTNGFTVTPKNGTAQTVTVTPSIDKNVTYTGTLVDEQVAAFEGTTGQIKASGFTIGTSVPAGAVFTDTKYTASTGLSLDTDTNAFSLKTATTSAIGGIKIHKDNSNYAVTAATSSISSDISSGKYYAVEIDKNDKAFVYVPWVSYSAATTSANGLMTSAMVTKLNSIAENADNVSFSRKLTTGTEIGTITINGVDTKLYCETNTNTTYTASTGLSLSADNAFSLNTAKTDTIGGIKIHKDNSSYAITANTSPTITADQSGGKYYAVEIDKNDKAYVYVPWEDNNDDTKNTAGAGNKVDTKMFLVGRTGQSTGTSYSNVNVYIGTDNCLYSNGTKVSVDGHTHDYLSSLPTHTHPYTDLTGSGTTKNQAIVSSGTANGWKLLTLGAAAEYGVATSVSSGGTGLVTSGQVYTAITSGIRANDAMVFKGTVSSNSSLPASHKVGDTYRITAKGTYAGVSCEVGDMIICITEGSSANNSHWTVVQTNIDGAVIGPSGSTTGNIAVFDGDSGKLIKDSGFTIGKSVPSDALFTDTKYTHPDATTISTAGLYKIKTNSGGHIISATAVAKSDITDLGIPGKDTTYEVADHDTAGLIMPWMYHSAAATGPTAGSNTTAVAVNSITNTANRYYAVEMDKNGRAFVNVPWVEYTYTYTLPVATSSARGGIKIGYTDSGANVAVKLSSEKAYVALTSAAVVAALGFTPISEDKNTTYSIATSSVAGLIKPIKNYTKAAISLSATSDTTTTANITVNSITNTAGKYYAVEMDKNGRAFVNVPWQAPVTYSAGTGISISNNTISNSGVRSISSGSTNGTISVNTGGSSAEVAVAGLGSAAYTASTAYLSSGTKYAASSSVGGVATSAAKLSNTSAIGSASKPVYFSANGVPVECTSIAGVGIIEFKVTKNITTDWVTFITADSLGASGKLTSGTYLVQIYGGTGIGYSCGVMTWHTSGSTNDEILLHRTGASTNVYARLSSRAFQIAGSGPVASQEISIKFKKLI